MKNVPLSIFVWFHIQLGPGFINTVQLTWQKAMENVWKVIALFNLLLLYILTWRKDGETFYYKCVLILINVLAFTIWPFIMSNSFDILLVECTKMYYRVTVQLFSLLEEPRACLYSHNKYSFSKDYAIQPGISLQEGWIKLHFKRDQSEGVSTLISYCYKNKNCHEWSLNS